MYEGWGFNGPTVSAVIATIALGGALFGWWITNDRNMTAINAAQDVALVKLAGDLAAAKIQITNSEAAIAQLRADFQAAIIQVRTDDQAAIQQLRGDVKESISDVKHTLEKIPDDLTRALGRK